MDSCFWCKIVALSLTGCLSGALFIWSLCVDYQWELAKEHVRFRGGFPSQANWITSPYGTLSCYLFNVTNYEAFLRGEDKKMKLQQIGPIVYRVKGHNQILEQTADSLTYRKLRYQNIEFDPIASAAPDILNQTIVLPNLPLLGAAAKFHNWTKMLRALFNGVTYSEPVFLKESVYYFLWDFRLPGLTLLAKYVPDLVYNCGMLYNAIHRKEEIYNTKIGVDGGMENFFRVNTLNGKSVFPEHFPRYKYLNKTKYPDLYCPIEVAGAFDNSLFSPFTEKYKPMSIVAAESCRTLDLKYNRTVQHLGFTSYQYIITDEPNVNSCLNDAMGIKLHSRMFDVSKCLFNDVPAAFSSPHFYGSSYNWSEHFEGLAPNIDLHEASLLIEPITGIAIEETYRFQSNMPMPDMTGYSKSLEKFSHMVIPTFWYEYDLDDLPAIVMFLMRSNVFGILYIQPLLTILSLLYALFAFLKCYLIYKQIPFKAFFTRHIFDKFTKKELKTTFESSSKEKDKEEEEEEI